MMEPRLRVMGRAFLEFHEDGEFRARIRALLVTGGEEKLRTVMIDYFINRGLSKTEAMLMVGMYASGGLDSAETIVERTP